MRATARLVWLGAESLFAAVTWVPWCVVRGSSAPAPRAAWLQYHARRTVRVFCGDLKVLGTVPTQGLLVCNHLSYLDVLVIAALTRCFFVAKSDVRRWPVFGWFARMAGKVFADRERRARAGQAANEMEAALRNGSLVVLFPEGTSSDGETVLPFKSSLLEPAARQRCSLAAELVSYELPDGNASEEVCYWKDMTLVPHLINLLGRRPVWARIRFVPVAQTGANRKEFARQLHAEVLRLKNFDGRESVLSERVEAGEHDGASSTQQPGANSCPAK